MAMKNFLKEFEKFIMRGNVIDMAVGVIVGAAFQGIVNSLVNDVISPLLGLIANTDLNMMTLSAGLSTLRGQFTTNYPVLMAGSVLAMVPMVILYLVFQKQFIEGIAMTGGK